jgi:hypothetical protein
MPYKDPERRKAYAKAWRVAHRNPPALRARRVRSVAPPPPPPPAPHDEEPDPEPMPTAETAPVPEESHVRKSPNPKPETVTVDPSVPGFMVGPESSASPMPPEVAQAIFNPRPEPPPRPSVPVAPSNRSDPRQPHQMPGFGGYSCPECGQPGFVEKDPFQSHMKSAHGYRWVDGILSPSQKTLTIRAKAPSRQLVVAPRPFAHELPWEKVPEWEPVKPKNQSPEELKAQGWEPVPKPPTKRDLIARGWTPATEADLVADGWEAIK